jgi:hypothetical protein
VEGRHPSTILLLGLLTLCVLLAGLTCSHNSPPEILSLTGPARCAIDSTAEFKVIAADPENDSVSYRLSWGDGDTTEWTDWHFHWTYVTAEHSWFRPGIYAVRAVVRDTRGWESDWSEPVAVTVLARMPGTLRWQAAHGDDVDGAPAIGPDGTIVFTSYDGRVRALNPDGTLKWFSSTGGHFWRGPTIGPDGTVYAGSSDGIFHAFKPDGGTLWTYRADSGFISSAALGPNGETYFGTEAGMVHALTPSGDSSWQHAIGGVAWSPVVGRDGTIYVVSGRNLDALNPDGTQRWRCEVDGNIHLPAALAADGTIYVGSSGHSCGAFHAVDPDGIVKWQFPLSDYAGSSAAIDSAGNVYFTMRSYLVYCLGPDGTERWRYRSPQALYGTPALGADGTVYVTGSIDAETHNVSLLALSADGKLKWSYYLGGSRTCSPTLGQDSIVYVGSELGLYAVQAETGPADSPWPMYQHDPQNTGRATGP